MAQRTRPPVVTIMGHVDHGKTTLLDYIRHTRVAAGEAGGITQHIGAYQAEFQGKLITFIDTPGHAAFSKMRSRGAAATDIVVLVVAADDGVKPQTVESIQHIKKAGVPFIVAINKMDAMGASPDMVKAQLTEHEVYVQGYGGDIDVLELSAKSGQGVDVLLETLATMGELLELQADPEAPLEALVIESSRDKARGSIATLLVRQGTLRLRTPLFAEGVEGTARTLTDAAGRQLSEALPGTPVEVTGFKDVPPVGARVLDEAVETQRLPDEVGPTQLLGFTDDQPKLKLILKTDVLGSLEAIKQSLPQDNLELIGEGVGDVNESDVLLAEATGAMIVAFQVKAPGAVKKLADRSGIIVKNYRIIYELLDELQLRILRLIEPDLDERELGSANVLQIFNIRGTVILGCTVSSGRIRKGETLHLKRGEKVLADAKAISLKQGKTDVDMVETGTEFGLVLDKSPALQVGDTVVAFEKLDLEK